MKKGEVLGSLPPRKNVFGELRPFRAVSRFFFVSVTPSPLNIPKMTHFFKKLLGGVPPDPPITGSSTCNPPFVLVWIQP